MTAKAAALPKDCSRVLSPIKPKKPDPYKAKGVYGEVSSTPRCTIRPHRHRA
ncbi:hypothetical protein [Streptomyces sp. TRM68367]|uniref:hypothetical protein n=1 Tax=Streptomyces sp. TRM68367 TaxID=2758415 RepID=UPI00165A83E1|nr:hypothetical protein [Streptomyces sp. TRM68367]MBC9725695.1 hypothetical protein [Streptomyces sp. TRM68367]